MRFWKRKSHRHYGYRWDGYYEYCRCGACAGDRRNPKTGMRCIEFSEWEEGA